PPPRPAAVLLDAAAALPARAPCTGAEDGAELARRGLVISWSSTPRRRAPAAFRIRFTSLACRGAPARGALRARGRSRGTLRGRVAVGTCAELPSATLGSGERGTALEPSLSATLVSLLPLELR